MVEWFRLRSYESNRWKSFEEFCYCVARGLYDNTGDFTPIDDSGGGDGVEFYLTLPDGREWGWQAKFYHPNLRLSVSGRKPSILNSLKRAISNHARLEKWFLCTPTNFTTNEEKWFKELQKKQPEVTLKHWSESDFNYFLTKPHFLGVKNHFFGDLELSIDWFRTQVEKQIVIIGNKFFPNLHAETKIDSHIHALLGDYVFSDHLKEQVETLETLIGEFDKTVEELRTTYTEFNWQKIQNQLLTHSSQLRINITEIVNALDNSGHDLSSGLFDQVRQIDWGFMKNELQQGINNYSRVVHDFSVENLQGDDVETERRNVGVYISQKCNAPLYIVHEITEIFNNIKNGIEKLNHQSLQILGGAGIGKTHVASYLCQKRVENNLPAILLLGKHFTNHSPIERQILRMLDVPNDYSWKDFVHTLESIADVYKTRIPIVIDGLNEAQSIEIWKRELSGFTYELTSLPQVILITTCRSSYQKEIWQSSKPENPIEMYGFSSNSIEDATSKYFDWYKIRCDLTMAPLRQFSHPIFLKIFCESQNRERKEEKQIYLGEQTLLQVLEEYITKCNRVICTKLSKHPSTRIVHFALKRVAKELWDQKSQSIPLFDAVKLIDSEDLENLDWLNSITNMILNEGLLISRDFIKGEDAVLFPYNLLGGYIIAKGIISTLTPENLDDFIGSEKFNTNLLSDIYSERHPLHEDILRCVALLLPMRFGKHLHQLTNHKEALDYSINAIFEIDPKFIDNSSKELIAKLFSHPENREPLLKLTKTTITHVKHPLNIEFWGRLLSEMSMVERDLSWTEFVRWNSSDFSNDLYRFENVCKIAEKIANITQQRLALAAKYFCWLLTSTVRTLRDTATRALYWYGRRFPIEFFDLVLNSLTLNDPCIPERLLAATYGVAMALQYDLVNPRFCEEALPTYAIKIYEAMFKPNAPYATTHILMRDYAKRLIDLALIHNPNILTVEEQQKVTPPFASEGIRNWDESEDKDKDKYREGSMPIHMDFGNYTIGCLVRDRGNYAFDHPDYKKVLANIFWRLYDLGYSHDLFKEVDRKIHRLNWHLGRVHNRGKVDRYGKKYSWIAFYELAGFRQDNDLLPKYYSEEPRISDADIDPSFPEPAQKYEVIKSDYLGNRTMELSKWIESSSIPDLTPYLKVEGLLGERGPWVLLNGNLHQEDLQAKRGVNINSNGLIVKKGQAVKIVECLKEKRRTLRFTRIDAPRIYYTYAGEIPWCDTFPYNGKIKLEFVTDWAKESVRTLEEATSIEALLPASFYVWEDYHSEVNRAGGTMIPAKELAEFLDLCSRSQSFDLFEKNGKRASITLKWGSTFQNGYHLLYLRKDLLECYLEEKNAELVWAISGNRQFNSEDMREFQDYSEKYKGSVVFQTGKTYS